MTARSFAPFQLPAVWDGRDVEWRAWEPQPPVFACPPQPREPCERCRSTTTPLMNHGIVHPAPTPGTVNLRPSLRTLTAFRCPDCHLDTVWDRDTDDWWTLDETDYGPAGSHDPRLPMEVKPVISCRDLWHRNGTWAPTLLRGALRTNGRLIVTDRGIAIYVDELDGCTDMPAPNPMTAQQVRTLSYMLVAPWRDIAPDREFDTRYLDLLEFAGYVVRPLMGYLHAHAVIAADGRVVGALMPVSTAGTLAPPDVTRKAGA